MAHRVGKGEDVARALLRLANDDLAGAARDLSASGRRDARIHRVRQRLKRVRSILRVLEPQFGEAAIEARHAVANAARHLARARDADVAAENARRLATASGLDDSLGFANAADRLDREASETHRHRTPLADVTMRLAEASGTILTFTPDFDGHALLAGAVRTAYARGRRAMGGASASLSTPDLHQWRKAVKDLWHLLRLARARLPKGAHRMAKQLRELGELLGDDNDHALLAEKLALSPVGDPNLMSQLGLIARERNALEARAFALGRLIYRRKPKSFARKFPLD